MVWYIFHFEKNKYEHFSFVEKKGRRKKTQNLFFLHVGSKYLKLI